MISKCILKHVKVLAQLSRVVDWNKESEKIESIFIAGYERENIISYVDFSKICQVINCFPELKQTFQKEDITFILYSSSRDTEWRKNNMIELELYMGQIDRRLYNYFTINKKIFKDSFIYTLVNEMRDTCDEIHRKQYKQLRTLFITLCLESHDRYYFDILRMIKLFYHLYIENEIYAMSYKKQRRILNDSLFIQNGMRKWDYYIKWYERLINMGYWL